MYDRGLPTRGVHGLYESQAHPTDLLQVQVLGSAANLSARKQHGYDSELILSLPSKHAPSDPEALWLWPIMAITTSVQPESARIV